MDGVFQLEGGRWSVVVAGHHWGPYATESEARDIFAYLSAGSATPVSCAGDAPIGIVGGHWRCENGQWVLIPEGGTPTPGQPAPTPGPVPDPTPAPGPDPAPGPSSPAAPKTATPAPTLPRFADWPWWAWAGLGLLGVAILDGE